MDGDGESHDAVAAIDCLQGLDGNGRGGVLHALPEVAVTSQNPVSDGIGGMRGIVDDGYCVIA